METNNVFIDKWEIKNTQYSNRSSVMSNNERLFVIEHYADKDTERHNLETLIVTAVNNCKMINPANPLAAATEILNLYEAAREALSLFDDYPETNKSIGTFEVLNNAVNGALKGYFNNIKKEAK